MCTFQTQRLLLVPQRRFQSIIQILFVRTDIYKQENSKKQYKIQQHDRQKFQTPEEIYSSGKSHQKRWITYRCQTAANIGHDENEENHNLCLSLSPCVGTKQRTDHKHTGSCGSDPAGQQTTDQDQQGIQPRAPCHISFETDISRHTEQSKQ